MVFEDRIKENVKIRWEFDVVVGVVELCCVKSCWFDIRREEVGFCDVDGWRGGIGYFELVSD